MRIGHMSALCCVCWGIPSPSLRGMGGTRVMAWDKDKETRDVWKGMSRSDGCRGKHRPGPHPQTASGNGGESIRRITAARSVGAHKTIAQLGTTGRGDMALASLGRPAY